MADPRMTAAERVFGEKWFERWEAMTKSLEADGMDQTAARERATEVLELMANGVLLAREAGSVLPWRETVKTWDQPKRQRWTDRADVLQGEGLDWRSAEHQAFQEMTADAPFDPSPRTNVPPALSTPGHDVPPATPMQRVPGTLAEWMAAWKVGKKGTPYCKFGSDCYAVFRSQYGRGWKSSVGRSFPKESWPDAEAAKEGLYRLVREMHPERLQDMHAGRCTV